MPGSFAGMDKSRLFLFELVRAPWYIHRGIGHMLMPIAHRFATGQGVPAEMYAQIPHAPASEQEEIDMMNYRIGASGEVYGNYGDAKEPTVSVTPVMGVLSKWGSSATWGSREIAAKVLAHDARPDVLAHVLHFDTPGGAADGLRVASEMIRGAEKPIIALVDGMACSAGMWLLSTCQEIYATDPDEDLLGSIGTFIGWIDMKGKVEKDGGTWHEYYGTKSKRKNEAFRKAMGRYDDGKKDPSLIYSEILDPHVDMFHAYMREHFPQINELPEAVQENEIFSGATFTAKQALSYNLIQGISTFEAVIERAFELGHSAKAKRKVKYTL